MSAQGSPADSARSARMGKGYKVAVCGMASVGKTAVLEQLLYGKHTVGEIFLLVGAGGVIVSFCSILFCVGLKEKKTKTKTKQ